VPPGTPSAAVLVTTLENRLQPLIRCRLADSFTEQPPAPGHGCLRARVDGRSDEVFRFGDVALHALVVRSVLVHCPRGGLPRAPDTAGIAIDVLTSPGTTLPPWGRRCGPRCATHSAAPGSRRRR
jgi:phenylacetate-CoA ligase